MKTASSGRDNLLKPSLKSQYKDIILPKFDPNFDKEKTNAEQTQQVPGNIR